ncbi:unnamed protein product, partial [Mesorhabditis belari]|uniref:G-protein coupled receptors family 1 profile domain-containing protein n=1 Tax=Mesorhabditis belari TaxID=2138241 RepID=A0AAF3EGD8_9BILA
MDPKVINVTNIEPTEAKVLDLEEDCKYWGTDYIEGKIWLIGFFGTSLALASIILNTFLCVVYFHTPSLRKSAVLYFGVIAIVDILLGFNYIAAMSVPVIFDRYHLLWLYHLFLSCVNFVICESNCAIFSSSLLIILATTERLLRTFQVKTSTALRRFVEKNRVFLCLMCIIVSIGYKLSTYFEIEVVEKGDCPVEWFGRFEIKTSEFVNNSPSYRFFWMFLTKFIIDRILPFVLLLLMNFKIIAALKQQTFVPKKALFAPNASIKCNRQNIRDATRTLILMVSMHIISQTPQVILSIWEFTDPNREQLEGEELKEFYSYANDIIPIVTLLMSCLRFPVYLANNRQINEASWGTLRDLCQPLCAKRKPQDYHPIKQPPTASLTNGKGSVDLSRMEKRIEVFANGNKIVSGPTTESAITETTSNQSATHDYHLNEYIL